MALDAEQRGVARPERPFGGPRSRPGVRILDGHAIPERLRIDAREALDDVEAFARVEVVRLAAEGPNSLVQAGGAFTKYSVK